MHAAVFPWLTWSLPRRPQLDPGIDKDAKIRLSTPGRNSFLTPSIPAPLRHACPRLNRPPLSFYDTSRRRDRAFRSSVHGAHSSWKRICFGESERQWATEDLGGMSRETLKLIGEAQEKGEEEVIRGERSPQSQIQMSLMGFQGHWIVSILHFFLFATASPSSSPRLSSFPLLSSSLPDFIGSY